MSPCLAHWLKQMLDEGYLTLETLKIPEISMEKFKALEKIENILNKSWIVKHLTGSRAYMYVFSVIELLHGARDIPYKYISCEEGYVGGIADILAEKGKKFISVELGSFPPQKYFSVLWEENEEFWFDWGEIMYVLRNPKEIPLEKQFFQSRRTYRKNCARGDYYLINCKTKFRDSCFSEFIEEKRKRINNVSDTRAF